MRYCALLLACVALNAQDQPTGRGVNFYSKEKEAALGAQLAGEVRQKTTAIDSAAAQEYVARLGARLIAQIPDTGFTFTFTIAADGMGDGIHEPPALPGGYIFAGMLAHSIAHVVARHGTRQATRAEVVSIASVPLIFMGGWYAMQQGAGCDPDALVRYIGRVQPPPDGTTSKVYSPLPERDQRVTAMEQAIQGLPARAYSSGEAFPPIQDEVRRLAR